MTTSRDPGALVVLPVTRSIPLPEADPYTLFRAIGSRKGCILESMEGVPRRAVRSIIGLEPPLIFTLDGEITCTGDQDLGDQVSIPEGGHPIRQLRELCSQFHCVGGPITGFVGGLVGYCAYDMVTELSAGLVNAGKEGALARFMLCTRGIVYDHVHGSCLLFDDPILYGGSGREEGLVMAQERMDALEKAIRNVPPGRLEEPVSGNGEALPLTATMNRGEYIAAVRRAKEHIQAGNIFQVVLSRRLSCPYQGDPLDMYGAIRAINPSPYLYCLKFGDETVIGSSPEMLVKVEGTAVQTVPIAGTRPRGGDPAEDERLAADLLADPKERAEHLMLVDLARNDIGRVAAFGSVHVPEYMEVERFSHVQHIVSRVCGTLREGCDRFDALSACFPAGTVSGAPKIRAMQIIAELEAHPRGLYAGAVGYAGFNELLEFAITIRTLIARDGKVEFSTGAGIVADSVPAREFEETEHKAGAMMKAVQQAGVRR
ncbi:MAG: anthranilate synthase component I family protein [Methanolinea sp.]|jgi:anthranilate synthase component 1|nr:anthranilate synthase component I family protein [Methanolinea sp.]